MSAVRFTQAAKANDSGSWNRYAYTRGDPVNRTDGRGTCVRVNLFGELFRSLTRGASGYIVEALPFVCALAIGYLLPGHGDGERQVARWTWVVPLIVFILLFAWEWADFGGVVASKAFFEAEPSSGEGIAAVLFTFPTVSSIAYSIGAVLSLRFSRSKTEEIL
jgi:hypothetical protein